MRSFQLQSRMPMLLLLATALLLGNALFYGMVLRPRLASVRTADSTTLALEASVRDADGRLAALRARSEEMTRARDALQAFFTDTLSTKEARLVKVQRELSRIASDFAVTATQLRFEQEPVTGTDLVRLAVELPLVGGYNNLRQFLRQVEASSEFLVVDSVQLQEGEQGGAMLNLRVRISTYYADRESTADRYKLES